MDERRGSPMYHTILAEIEKYNNCVMPKETASKFHQILWDTYFDDEISDAEEFYLTTRIDCKVLYNENEAWIG